MLLQFLDTSKGRQVLPIGLPHVANGTLKWMCGNRAKMFMAFEVYREPSVWLKYLKQRKLAFLGFNVQAATSWHFYSHK
jgi:hypothetical protein